MNSSMRRLMAGAALMAAVSVVSAQPGGGAGYGGGPMMGGYGPGMMGGYGPGMMGGGYGGGMMGYGHPGMMGGGYGGGMMGYGHPGMMGGGYGGGMMGGYGMGPGYGRALQRQLDLTDDQRKKLDAIHDDLAKSQWDTAGRMHTEMASMRELMLAEPRDRAALEAAFKRMNGLREQRFAAMLAARDQIDGVLTPEQRAKLRRAFEE